MSRSTVLAYYTPERRTAVPVMRTFAAAHGLELTPLHHGDDLIALVNRTFPAGVVLDAASADAVRTCRILKRDAFRAVVPVVMLAHGGDTDAVLAGLAAGADEVLTLAMSDDELVARLGMLLRRADRDVSVHPTTRLPGSVHIDRDISERIRRGERFAVCYADLDHFKEFNDRYGYNAGDGVIRILARILRDIVRGHAPDGFIGHIGGDDFIFNVGLDVMRVCCEDIIEVFDELVPYQYTPEDRGAGYFLGRDRRGNILWVPLMTLSIGVVTNRDRRFEHTARVSELATEMKMFAKKLPGSVYAVDRRSDRMDAFDSRPNHDEPDAPSES